MMQIIILLILSIVLAALVIFLIVCYSDYRQNDDYDRLFKEQFRLHSDSLETYEAMMREAGRYWKSDEEPED